MQGGLQWERDKCWVVRHRACGRRGESGWKGVVLLLPAEELGWEPLPGKPWEVAGFPKAVGRQGRGAVCAGDSSVVHSMPAQGVWRGGLLLALGTAFTGSSPNAGV